MEEALSWKEITRTPFESLRRAGLVQKAPPPPLPSDPAAGPDELHGPTLGPISKAAQKKTKRSVNPQKLPVKSVPSRCQGEAGDLRDPPGRQRELGNEDRDPRCDDGPTVLGRLLAVPRSVPTLWVAPVREGQPPRTPSQSLPAPL